MSDRTFASTEDKKVLSGKRVLITGATGTFGKALLRRLMDGSKGNPAKVVMFSRDEERQREFGRELQTNPLGGDQSLYRTDASVFEFRIGDIRDYDAVTAALRGIDIVLHAAALKDIQMCENLPNEAVATNIIGAQNIIRAIERRVSSVEAVVGISTSEAVNPVNVMGMTRALQERILLRANRDAPETRFVLTRCGEVLASRRSPIPLFRKQVLHGGPVTVADPNATMFLPSLGDAVTVVVTALQEARSGETYVPIRPSARVLDVAAALIDGRPVEIAVTGKGPGERTHQILISDEECHRTIRQGCHYVVRPFVHEAEPAQEAALHAEYSSADDVLPLEAVQDVLTRHDLMVPHRPGY